MPRVLLFFLRHARLTLAAVLAVTVFLALQLPLLTQSDSVDKMLPEGDPVIAHTREMEEIFGNDEFLVVALESPNPFTAPTVAKLIRMTREFSKIPEVREAVSASNTKNVVGVPENLFTIPLVDETNPPKTEEELRALRRAILSKDFFRGSIVSEDGTAFGIILRMNAGADKKALVQAVQAVVDAEKGPENIYFTGSPAINLQVGRHMGADMARFFPLVILLIGAALWFGFGSLWCVLLSLVVLLLAVIWVLGLMALTKTPMSVISTMLPTLLIAVGSSYAIHVLTEYAERGGEEGRNRFEAVAGPWSAFIPRSGWPGSPRPSGSGR